MSDNGGNIRLECDDESQLPRVADEVLRFAGTNRIILFNGDLGAGKTTLIKVICERLECLDVTSSPSFNIINEYLTRSGETVFHFDCYRLKEETEAYDIGMEEYLDSGSYCLVEWPEKIPSLLPDHYISVNISLAQGEKREFYIQENE